MKYHRAYISRGNGESLWFDFPCEGDPMGYARSQNLGEVVFLETLPACFSPYDMPYAGTYEPAQYCDNDCPTHTTEELAEIFTDEVVPCGCDYKLLHVGDTNLPPASAGNTPVFRRYRQRVKDLFNRLLRDGDEAMAMELVNHVRLAGHSLQWHVFESGDEVIGFTAVSSNADKKPYQIEGSPA